MWNSPEFYLLFEPVDGPLPLGGGLYEIILGHRTALSQADQELDTLVGPPALLDMVQLDHSCNGKNNIGFIWLHGLKEGHITRYKGNRVHFRLASSQWETLLQSNAVSHWLGTNLKSALGKNTVCLMKYVDGSVQDSSNSIANAMELPVLY